MHNLNHFHRRNINGSAKLQYHLISLRQSIMNKLLIRLLRSKDQDDHNFHSTNYV